ncbi:hypothetical protein [Brachybacterium endophyticum]|uniref:hypothetical protein n=1 Tax=Brachybacterium endophyticum TaxID=2182385 RepID=UPI00140287F1|nr:hypothetical protein [Brachybacterium endophyticum]
MAGNAASGKQPAKTPSSTGSAGKNKAVELALMAAPVAFKALKKLLDDPTLGKKAQEQIARLLKYSGGSPADMLETVKALREQVDYLSDSADDEREAQRAQAWSKQLEQCERAAQLVNAPGSTRKERRALNKRISTLRSEILEAFIDEQEEGMQEGDNG